MAALATIKTSSDNRELRLRDFVAFRQAAIDEGKTGAMKRVVFTAGKDAGRAALLAATLRRSGVEVGVATASFSSAAAHAYSELPKAAAAQKTFEQGTYVVDLSQPLGRWARAVLEPEAKLNPEFVTAELARRLAALPAPAQEDGHAELELEFAPTAAFNLRGTFGYLNTKYDKFADAGVDFSGRPTPYSPQPASFSGRSERSRPPRRRSLRHFVIGKLTPFSRSLTANVSKYVMRGSLP